MGWTVGISGMPSFGYEVPDDFLLFPPKLARSMPLPMIHFSPHSPWPRRLRRSLIALAVLVLILAILRVTAQRMVVAQGGIESFTTRAKLKGIEVGIGAFHLANGRYPTTAEGFEIIYTKHKNRSSFLTQPEQDPTKDGWGRRFSYEWPGTHNPKTYDLWSRGEDGEDGTEDDITNW